MRAQAPVFRSTKRTLATPSPTRAVRRVEHASISTVATSASWEALARTFAKRAPALVTANPGSLAPSRGRAQNHAAPTSSARPRCAREWVGPPACAPAISPTQAMHAQHAQCSTAAKNFRHVGRTQHARRASPTPRQAHAKRTCSMQGSFDVAATRTRARNTARRSVRETRRATREE